MTVLKKPSVTIKKSVLIDENRCDEEVIDIQPSGWVPSKRYRGAVICMGVIAALLLLMGVITALQIYEQVMTEVQRPNRYQGFCSIPLTSEEIHEERKSPLSWKSAEFTDTEDFGLQVIDLLQREPERILDTLREVLDIDIDNSVEKVSVVNNGRSVYFVHDFELNVTGIVDEDRCFIKDLNPEDVLMPKQLVYGLEHGQVFDVTRKHSAWLAELPELEAAPPSPAPGTTRSMLVTRVLGNKCAGKPIYQLYKGERSVIRKRAADAPPHDYIQFAGKRIQEIEISNLAELLEYEQKNKLAAETA